MNINSWAAVASFLFLFILLEKSEKSHRFDKNFVVCTYRREKREINGKKGTRKNFSPLNWLSVSCKSIRSLYFSLFICRIASWGRVYWRSAPDSPQSQCSHSISVCLGTEKQVRFQWVSEYIQFPDDHRFDSRFHWRVKKRRKKRGERGPIGQRLAFAGIRFNCLPEKTTTKNH